MWLIHTRFTLIQRWIGKIGLKNSLDEN